MTSKQKRYLFAWLHILFSVVAPLVIFAIKYGLFTESVGGKKSLTICALFGILYILIKLWSSFVEWTQGLDEGIFREVLGAIGKLGPYMLLVGLSFVVKFFIEDFQFVIWTLFLSNFIGIVFDALHNYYRRKEFIARGDVRVLK